MSKEPSKYLVCHPTGNANVRAVLDGLDRAGLLEIFYTTVAVQPGDWPLKLVPAKVRTQLLRRSYRVSHGTVHRAPTREMIRQVANRMHWSQLTAHEVGWASVDAVYRDLDRRAAQWARSCRSRISGVYCYEDGALQTFREAAQHGLARVYDLPIAYVGTLRRLLQAEAERWPAWRATLAGTFDSTEKVARKEEELALADVVMTPSRFVYDSLPAEARAQKACHIVAFGSPQIPPTATWPERSDKLRVLFVGSMTQRKGLADLFEAVKLLQRSDVELVVLGSLNQPLEFYRQQYADFTYEPPRPHSAVLELMRSCDVLALPSIVEGRALVQQEALACGLPIVVTPNAGGEDLVTEGETGFLVPPGSPDSLAEKLAWLADHRALLPEMREQSMAKAAEYTWMGYGDKVAEILRGKVGAVA
jgi:glycosyltransferase involved in cell wall biosynthesis